MTTTTAQLVFWETTKKANHDWVELGESGERGSNVRGVGWLPVGVVWWDGGFHEAAKDVRG